VVDRKQRTRRSFGGERRPIVIAAKAAVGREGCIEIAGHGLA
jgi:hypothetical protein